MMISMITTTTNSDKSIITQVVFLLMTLMLPVIGNHIGFSPFYFCLPIAFNLMIHIILKNKLGIFSSALCILIIFLFDKFNILVEYNEWLHRGMPDPFTWS
jgi:hypothetical protein